LLGAPRIEQDGEQLQVDTRKAVALLAYLAVTGECHRRATLVDLLWPEYDRQRGRTALRRTIYALKKAISGDLIEVDRQSVGIQKDADIWVDVNQFRSLLSECERHDHQISQICSACLPALSEAVNLYHADFLTGFGLKDSFNFDEWQLNQADQLRTELTGALERLERWYIDQHDYETALGYARHHLALDPLDEQTHSRLMRLYTWSGQRTSALRQYQACVKILRDQLGIPPHRSLTVLYESIKKGSVPPTILTEGSQAVNNRISARAISLPSSPPFLYAQLPRFLQVGKEVERPLFVARESELAKLRGYLEDAQDGHGRVVFIRGEAGSGKTALLHEFAYQAQQSIQDLVVAWGRCNAHTGYGDPYLPFREILELLTGDVESRWAAGAMTLDQAQRLWQLVPLMTLVLMEFGPDLITLFTNSSALVKRAAAFATNGSEWVKQLQDIVNQSTEKTGYLKLQQSALYEQYTRVIHKLSEQYPVVMILDDLQWADIGSTSLLFHLGRRIEGSRTLIVGAYRPADIIVGQTDSVRFAGPSAGASASYFPPQGGSTIGLEEHPLVPLIYEFKRSFGDIEVDLEQAHSRRFVNDLLDSQPNRLSESFRETLFKHTRGYPLFTIELLRGMQDRGDLVQDEQGQWLESTELNWDLLPARIEAVIAQRIHRLPERLQEILEVACVEGESFTAEVVEEVVGIEHGELIRSLSRSLDREHRLISAIGITQQGGQRFSQYRFNHILFQKYLYNHLDSIVRTQWHQVIGLTLERLYVDQTERVTIQLARHFDQAGMVQKAVEYLKEAGEQAWRMYANEEAQRYYRRALELLAGWIPPESLREWQQRYAAQLNENLAESLIRISKYDEASIALHAALDNVPPGDLVWQARLHCTTANLWRLQRCYQEALQSYHRAESILQDETLRNEDSWRKVWLEIQINRLWSYYWVGNWREMAELIQRVKPVVDQYGSLQNRIDILTTWCAMQYRRDRYAITNDLIVNLQQALALSMETGDRFTIALSQFDLGFACLWVRDFEGAGEHLTKSLESLERSGDLIQQARCLTYLTILYRMIGEPHRAREFALRSLEKATVAEMDDYIGSAQANLAWLAWQQGDFDEVEEKAHLALQLWEQTPLVYSFYWLALCPLIAVTVEMDRIGEAIEFARILLQDPQMRLQDELEVVLQAAIVAWESHDPHNAQLNLNQAIHLSAQLGYL